MSPTTSRAANDVMNIYDGGTNTGPASRTPRRLNEHEPDDECHVYNYPVGVEDRYEGDYSLYPSSYRDRDRRQESTMRAAAATRLACVPRFSWATVYEPPPREQA